MPNHAPPRPLRPCFEGETSGVLSIRTWDFAAFGLGGKFIIALTGLSGPLSDALLFARSQ
jgi:hypothetical protein